MLLVTKQNRNYRKDGRGMWHVWETGDVHTSFFWGGGVLRGANHLQDLCVDGR